MSSANDSNPIQFKNLSAKKKTKKKREDKPQMQTHPLTKETNVS